MVSYEFGIILRIDGICRLVNKFYSQDFTDHEKEQLKIEL
jgi:hypothetical protein